ncbi:hypothetical protein FHS96_000257 [Sphingomonas zeicaulis]|uniref:XrtV sorting system accessory protein n=1 Tax=Sphingomonas zeicaulis TaxID=1632740 RepID=UPI003D193CCB
MKTFYDFLSLALFAGLIVLFLQRSVGDSEDRHPIWAYLVPAVGCAAVNYAGNEGYTLVAIGLLVLVIAYVLVVLRPFGGRPPR